MKWGRKSAKRAAFEARLWPRDDRGHACDPTMRDSYAGQVFGALDHTRRDLFKKVDWKELAWGLVLHLPLLVVFATGNALLPAKLWGVDRFWVLLGCLVVLASVWGRLVWLTPFGRGVLERMGQRYWRDTLGRREGKGACLACGYALDGAPVEDDGCLQCPECGSAWKAGRVRLLDEPLA